MKHRLYFDTVHGNPDAFYSSPEEALNKLRPGNSGKTGIVYGPAQFFHGAMAEVAVITNFRDVHTRTAAYALPKVKVIKMSEWSNG